MQKLKDKFFQKEFIYQIANSIKLRTENFDNKLFVKMLTQDSYTSLELKAKLRQCAKAIGECFAINYLDSINVLMDVANDGYNTFDATVFPEFVDVYGQKYFKQSLMALEYFTVFGSSEFAIRSFANTDTDRVLVFLKKLAKSNDEHKRRFASEGCRPMLPWANKVTQLREYAYLIKIIDILDILKADKSKYVQKSVANNLNDISKLHSELVLATARKWINKNQNTDWILKHGLRTLLKKSNKQALRLWRLDSSEHVRIKEFYLEKNHLYIGDETYIIVNFVVEQQQAIRGEFKVHYLKNKGSYSIKTFSFFEKEFNKGVYIIKKKISFKDMSTRKHYAGLHRIDMTLNGDNKSQIEFQLYPKNSC